VRADADACGQIPISTSVRKCASNFKKTHQDTWHEDSQRFTEDQLTALSTLLTGSSYCAFSLLSARPCRAFLIADARPVVPCRRVRSEFEQNVEQKKGYKKRVNSNKSKK